MRLYLIRHAQSANNALPEEQRIEDPPITELGHRQASAVATWLATARLDHVVASPFRRSLETAEYLRRRLALTPRVWIDLHEQGGCYAGHEPDRYVGRPGLSRAQIAAEFPGYELESAISPEGWWKCQPYEHAEQARVRARRLIQRTLETFGAQKPSVAYVVHADFKRLLLEELFRAEPMPPRVWRSIYNTAVTLIEFRGAFPQLGVYNSTAHLQPELVSM